MSITYLQLITFVIAVFVFMITPGPGVFATIGKAMTNGAWSVLPLAVGLAAGDAIYMVFSAYGLSALATNFNTAFMVIKFVGAAYLFYLAYKMWVTVPELIATQAEGTANSTQNTVSQTAKKDGIKSMVSGFLISISNPKVILFYVSLLPSFFPVANLTGTDIAVLCVVIFISALVSMMLYAFMADYAQKQLKSSKARQRFNRVGASFMGLAGAWLLAKG